MKHDRAVTRRGVVVASGGIIVAAVAAIGAKRVLQADEDAATVPPVASADPGTETAAQLQRRIDAATSGDRISLTAGGSYVFDRTLTVRGTGVILDGAGATVRLSDTAERDSDRVIDVIGSKCTVQNLRIVPRPTKKNAFAASWTLQVRGDGNTIQRCSVDVAAGYAIGVAQGADNVIADNTVTGGGILYGWDEVSGTQCVRNTVTNTAGNAFSGVGNSDSGIPVRSCVVSDNVVQDCGRIAIEDFANVLGSRIENNRITRSEYMGISAVGAGTTIAQNVIVDGGRDYGIETGASDNVVQGNRLSWTTVGTATGLIVNNRWKFDNGKSYAGFRSIGNTISKALIGVSLNGTLPVVSLQSDVISDCGTRGISAEPTSAESVTITSATILFSAPSSQGAQIRDGISVAHADKVAIKSCRITYGAATRGPAKDYFVRVETAGTSIVGCTFDSSGRSDAKAPIVGSVSGPVAPLVTLSNNRYIDG